MHQQHGIRITVRDRLMKSWENSMELVRDFESFSQELAEDDKEAAQTYAAYAEEEGKHAAKFRDLLRRYETDK